MDKGKDSFLILILLILAIFFSSRALLSLEPWHAEETQREPLSEWSKQWLEEVVSYIITKAEKEVFLSLPNELERGKFIENFWKKRDPNPQTPENEFKLDYYRRIALANKFFGTGGLAGWRTDRGKIYILLGPPNEIQRDMTPSGTALSIWHGPKEIWRYWGLSNPRLPYNLEFVFVDKLGMGNYVLERSLQLGGSGPAQFDLNATHYHFDYLEIMAEAMRNPFDGLDRLKGIITTQVTYDSIPIDYEAFHLRGSEDTTYIPLFIEIPYSAVTHKEIEGEYYFNLTLFINVSDKLGSVVCERSKDINLKHTASEMEALKDKTFKVQTSLTLEPGAYTIHFLILDNFSGKVGTLHQELQAPSFSGEKLLVSDIILSSKKGSAEQEPGTPKEKISVEFAQTFQPGEEMEVHLEIYNMSLNPATGKNDIKVEYFFFQNEKLLAQVPSPAAEPTSEKDCRVQTSFRLKNFKPGEYTLRVKVIDSNSGIEVTREARFVVSQ